MVAGGTSYFGYDGLGSTKFLTDDNGYITDIYEYDAYGTLTSKTGDTDNLYLYTGEQFDKTLNQYYLRARYYNQGTGRFTQMDTWQGRDCTPVTLNKYVYGNGSPTLYTDPSGHMGLVSLSTASSGRGVLTSSAHNTVIIGAFKKAGCELGVALAEEAITQGIYILFDSVSKRYYVGQASNDIDIRYQHHLDEAKKKATSAWKANTQVVARSFVDGKKKGEAFDKMEQLIIDIMEEAGHDLRNKNSVIRNGSRPEVHSRYREFRKIMCK